MNSKENRGFKQTEIGNIPEDWKVKTIDEVAEIVGGGTPSTKNISYWDGEIAWITPKDLSDYKNRYIVKGERSITKKGLENSSAKLLPKNTVLLTTRAPIGYLAISGEPLSTNQGFRSLIPKNDVTSEFLFYLLKRNVDLLKSNAGGTTFRELSGSSLKSLKFSFPNLQEQKVITKILSSLDDKIEHNQQMNINLEQIGQTIFKHWFIDFEFPNKEGKPYLSSGGEMIESEMGKIPKGWILSILGNFGKIICGKTPSKSVKEYFNGPTPFIKIPDMRNNFYVINTEDSLTITGEESQKNKTISPNSICVSSIATVGLVSLTSKSSQTNQQINSIVPHETISTNYLFYLLKSIKNVFLAIASGGTATLNMNTGDFSNILILRPETKILATFQKITQPLFEKILVNMIEIEILTKLRDSLLPKLMSGEIRIPIFEG